MKKFIGLSICAGFCIGIGGMAFLMSPVKIIGAVLFSVGLLAVVIHGLKLFTGTICSTEFDLKSTLFQLEILLGNCIGAVAAAGIFLGTNFESSAGEIVAAKISASWIAVFCKAILCNVLICIAVDEWKSQKNALLVIFAVTVFVFCGFEHCVANIFYMAVAGNFSAEFFLINVIGNATGGICFWRLKRISE